MRRREFLVTTSLFALGCAARTRRTPASGLQRGVVFDAYQGQPTPEDFAAIRAIGATHVALYPFGYMSSHTKPEVRRYQGAEIDWSLTDRGLETMVDLAHDAGLRALFFPTLADFFDGAWRGEVRMSDEASWGRWFRSYRAFLLHYARLAQRLGVAGLGVGTELRETVHREAQWRETISGTRDVFDGWLTYAANWDDYERVPWWDAVDLIGVQAFFELGNPESASESPRDALMQAWMPIKQRLRGVSETVGRRVLFTEIGYKSHRGATAYPWKWDVEGPPDADLQRAAYEAAFETFWRESWFAGFYWWKWRPKTAPGSDYQRDFTPQGKPAERVVRKYYSDGA